MGRLRRALIAAALLAVIAGTAALLLTQLFVVRGVEVEGAYGLRIREIISASGISEGESIFAVDADAVGENIDALGTHAFAGLELELPDGVRITVRERSREAMIACGEGFAVVDGDAAAIAFCADVPDEDLVYISGAAAQEAKPGAAVLQDGRLDACRAVLGALSGCGADAYVSELNLADLQNLRLITRGGVSVLLGDAENMEEKIAWMKAAVQDIERRGEAGGELDVSGGGFAVYRK